MANTSPPKSPDGPSQGTATAGKYPTSGPLNYHKRLSLGAKDSANSPFGEGAISTKPTIANGTGNRNC